MYITGFDEAGLQKWFTSLLRIREFELALSSYVGEPIKGSARFTEHEAAGFKQLCNEILATWKDFCGDGNPEVLFTPISALPESFRCDHPDIDVRELSRHDNGGYAVVSAGDGFYSVHRTGCLTTVRPL